MSIQSKNFEKAQIEALKSRIKELQMALDILSTAGLKHSVSVIETALHNYKEILKAAEESEHAN